MVRNSPTQVRQSTDRGSIKTKRCQRAQLRYVAGHYNTSQQNKCDPLLIQNGRRCPQTSSNVPIFPWNVVVFNRIWMQAIGLGRTQPGGSPVAACTVLCNAPKLTIAMKWPIILETYNFLLPKLQLFFNENNVGKPELKCVSCYTCLMLLYSSAVHR